MNHIDKLCSNPLNLISNSSDDHKAFKTIKDTVYQAEFWGNKTYDSPTAAEQIKQELADSSGSQTDKTMHKEHFI